MEDKLKTTMIKTAFLLALSVFLFLTAGCSKLTKENYDKLRIGQDYGEVVKILGEADECGGAMGIKDCRWGNDAKHISVKFAGNKVMIFSSKGL